LGNIFDGTQKVCYKERTTSHRGKLGTSDVVIGAADREMNNGSEASNLFDQHLDFDLSWLKFVVRDLPYKMAWPCPR